VAPPAYREKGKARKNRKQWPELGKGKRNNSKCREKKEYAGQHEKRSKKKVRRSFI
jgi:hypothetical protein